ncbi:MAG TPA: hypothetical protein HPP77_03995 [Candidatus Hydrogenedentes bacterium]|nr:hypothetical protein [Candidatus Hydrogenedentota bacterium]HIJ73490.1 hypothetical protein [Candidatus Hydrogenedentota bacterium]
MKLVTCPHCGEDRFLWTSVPKEVVLVVPCPSCGEVLVLYRDKVVALNRKIIEDLTIEERRNHLANVIAGFLGSGKFPILPELRAAPEEDSEVLADDEEEAELCRGAARDPITQEEVVRFVQVELSRLDDPAYFKRHLGSS